MGQELFWYIFEYDGNDACKRGKMLLLILIHEYVKDVITIISFNYIIYSNQ